MNVSIMIGDRLIVSGTRDEFGGAVVPHPDTLRACSHDDRVMLELARDVLDQMLGGTDRDAVTRDELREVVRDEVRVALGDALRTSLADGIRSAQAPVTY